MKAGSMRGVTVSCIIALAAVWAMAPAHSASGCVFPNGDNSSVNELIAVIKGMKANCALPWRALRRHVANPQAKAKIVATYRAVATKYPDREAAVTARIADVEAAAGNPAPMLALADANVIAHPEDKTLANMSCFARAAYGFDIDHAMRYCDAAVANGRQGYALVNRGLAQLQLKKFSEAFSDFDEALRTRKELSDRDLVRAAYGRGVARLRLGDKDGQKDIDLAAKAYPHVVADFEDFGVRP